jgi:hypothetical protein
VPLAKLPYQEGLFELIQRRVDALASNWKLRTPDDKDTSISNELRRAGTMVKGMYGTLEGKAANAVIDEDQLKESGGEARVIVIEVVRLVGELNVTKVSEDSDVAVYSLALCQGDKLLVFDGPGVEVKCSTADVQLNIASHYKTAVSE